MNVNEINQHLGLGDLDLQVVLPHLGEYQKRSLPLPFEFGLNELPTESGIISIRGPRQYGKSTWLELMIADSIEDFGNGCAFYLNGDEVATSDELLALIVQVTTSFAKGAKVRRLFIDEITAVPHWERALKRAADQRIIKDVLVVTTGSKAFDLRRGQERLPGRKGRLAKTEYIFLPCSYRAYYTKVYRERGLESCQDYVLTGGSPFALNEMYHTEELPDFVRQITRDWVLGEVVQSGRNRTMLTNILRCLFKYGGNPVGFAKLARESGLANNTVASGYIEQLADLMCVIPSWPLDLKTGTGIMRKPCKFPFVNLSAAMAFYPRAPFSAWELDRLPPEEKSVIWEWAVAQEIWRRKVLKGSDDPENILFWSSGSHELDFVDENGDFVEVKVGKASAMEFSWFPKVFPRKRLTVICSTPFETDWCLGLTLHQYLLRDPYFSAYVTDVPENPDAHDVR
ncbi:MAG: ATP-binding protein [Oligoflexales bacterium]